MGEVASNIAHEINNPLTVIMAKAMSIDRALKREDVDAKKVVEDTDKILTTVEKISKIVKSVTDLARSETKSEFQYHSINDVLSESLEMCQSRFKGESIKFSHSEWNVRVKILCYPIQLTQVFVNLIVNAVHATRGLKDRWVKIECYEHANEIEVWVTDSGSGIPRDVANRLFDAFYTTKKQGEGTGLGLSISKSIIEDHGGFIGIDSQCENTRFIIRLPKPEVKERRGLPPLPKSAA